LEKTTVLFFFWGFEATYTLWRSTTSNATKAFRATTQLNNITITRLSEPPVGVVTEQLLVTQVRDVAVHGIPGSIPVAVLAREMDSVVVAHGLELPLEGCAAPDDSAAIVGLGPEEKTVGGGRDGVVPVLKLGNVEFGVGRGVCVVRHGDYIAAPPTGTGLNPGLGFEVPDGINASLEGHSVLLDEWVGWINEARMIYYIWNSWRNSSNNLLLKAHMKLEMSSRA